MTFIETMQDYAKAIANENVDDYHGEPAHIFTNPALNECISQVVQNTVEYIYKQQTECRLSNLFSHRNGLCLCYDKDRTNLKEITSNQTIIED